MYSYASSITGMGGGGGYFLYIAVCIGLAEKGMFSIFYLSSFKSRDFNINCSLQGYDFSLKTTKKEEKMAIF